MAGPWEKYGAAATAAGPWEKYAAPPPKPPEVSPVENAASAFWEGIGGGGILDIIRGGTSGNPEDAKKAVATIQALAGGIAHEPARVSEELARANIGRDPGKTLYHLAGAVPFVGAGIQQTSDDFAKGDYARGVGHGLAILLPFLAGPAGRGAARTAEAVGTAAETALPVTRAVVKAGGRDVAVGSGKTAVGAVLAKAGPLGEIGDVLAGVPIIKSGVKQMTQGLKSGYKAGREALAQRAAAAAPLVERPAPAWQRIAEIPENVPSPLADLSAQLQAAIDEMNARALERQGPAAPPPPARPAPAWQRIETTPETAPAPPQAAPAMSALERNPAAMDAAKQLEAQTRPDRMLDFLRKMDPELSAKAIDNLDPDQWELVARGAGSPTGTVPTPADIAAIRANLAEYEGAASIDAKAPTQAAKAPAEAAAEFGTKAAVRKRQPKAKAEPGPDLTESQLAESIARMEAGERPVATVAEKARNATAAEKRVEAYAQHFAADQAFAPEDIVPLSKTPTFPTLGRALKVGAPQGGEIALIEARMRQLRAQR